MTEPIYELLANTIGKTGRYQKFIIALLFLSRPAINWHPVLVVLVAPPVGNFTCTNTSLPRCDKDCPGHTFDHSVWEWTIVHEWDLVCDKAYFPSMIQSFIMSGQMVGNVAIGTFADRFGRKVALIAGILIFFVSAMSTVFVSSLWLYMALRWLTSFGIGIFMMPAFSLFMEFTSEKYRSVLGILFLLPCHIGQAMLGLIGYYVRRWDQIQLAVSTPWVFLLSFICIMPESARWLLTMRKTERVIKTLERGAKCNKLPIENIRSQVEAFEVKHPIIVHKGGTWSSLFKTKRMRMKTLVLFVNWFIVSMVWFGISQYMGQIAGNVFWNIAAAGLVQIPGNLMACVMVFKLGRKESFEISLIICSVPMFAMAIIMFFPNHPVWPIVLMACLSMMGVAMAFALIYVYSGELFPTIVRTLGLGVSSMFARFGAMVSPFLMETGAWGEFIPPLLFGTFPAIAVVCTFIFLPETKGHPMPDTVEEADEL